jgi:hypothetical protein
MKPQTNGCCPDYLKEDPWRIFRIMAEFVDSFETLSKVAPAVSIFGSARLKQSSPYYGAAEALARGLARQELTVITGGGPGIMEAANRGAAAGKGRSVGLNIQLPTEQRANPVREPAGQLPLLLLPQGLLREIQHRVRLHAGRVRHAG